MSDKRQSDARLLLTETDAGIVVEGPGCRVAVNPNTGALQSYRIGDRQLLSAPLAPNFWKVPNDNQYRNQYLNRLGPWRHAARDARVVNKKAERLDSGAVKISLEMVLPVGESPYRVDYVVSPDASVAVSCDYRPTKSQLPMLPKFGMTTSLPARYNQVRWYGRGPQETYWDRKTGGEIAIHQLSVEEMVFPYVRPQDTGNRTDVRWVSLTDEAGHGILIRGNEPLSIAAWPYTMADLEQATHDYQLPRRDSITLNIDHKLHGVGGDNSWRAHTHPQYTLPGGKPYSYSFTISPLKPQ